MKKLVVSPSPHIHSEASTQKLMRDVVIALIPALCISLIVYGFPALKILLVSIASCVFFEYTIQRYLLNVKSSISDYSAILTGTLLAFNLPSNLPLWMVVIGALVAIGIGKMSFGGLGRNIFNPALVGRVFLLISFPSSMTSFPAPEILATDALSGATLLSYMKEGLNQGKSAVELLGAVSYSDMFLGFKAGSMGEIGALSLLVGFVYLLWRKVITWHIPVFVLGTIAVVSGILWMVDPSQYADPMFHLLSGGAILGAVYMATDYVSSPMSKKGMIIFAVGIGLITIFIRTWGAYPEGISFAILIMNSTVPLLNKYFKPTRFGKK